MVLDPIVAVFDVQASSKWFQQVFGCKSKHGGEDFEVLVSEDDQVILCLHRWEAHEHPTMQDQTVKVGNGLILYFRSENIDEIRERLRKMDYLVDKEINLNTNSGRREFSVIEPNGYYLTVSEFHKFGA